MNNVERLVQDIEKALANPRIVPTRNCTISHPDHNNLVKCCALGALYLEHHPDLKHPPDIGKVQDFLLCKYQTRPLFLCGLVEGFDLGYYCGPRLQVSTVYMAGWEAGKFLAARYVK